MKRERSKNRALCVWLPQWPVQRLRTARPELKSREVVLYGMVRGALRVVACGAAEEMRTTGTHMPTQSRGHGPRQDRGLAHFAMPGEQNVPVPLSTPISPRRVAGGNFGRPPGDSPGAKGHQSSGIAVGMPLAEATALSPSAHFEQHDAEADRKALEQLAMLCEQFSPLVGIDRSDTLSLDVTGLGPLFGGEEALVQQVVRAFYRWGFTVRCALADTLGAAWALAHFGRKSPKIIAPGQTVAALADLPIAALRVESDVEILAELGIHSIGQLLPLPRDALAARFDPQLLLRLDQATGTAAEIIVPHRPASEITAETELEHPLEDRQAIDTILGQLMERISSELAARQRGAIQIECDLKQEGGETVRFVVGLFRASAQAKHLLELAQMQLERMVLAGRVTCVGLAVLLSAPLEIWQPELFEPSKRESRRQAAQLVDRLSNRLGREAVVRALPQADAQPEFAFRYEPLAGRMPTNRPQKSRQKRASRQNLSPEAERAPRWKRLPRPLRLESQPIRLQVVSVVPDGPPIQFQLHGTHRVARAWGPERIQTGWWRGRYVQRDYYRIETSTGKRFWLFRRLRDAQWFLHGEFD
jgi:protein ImuB